MFGESGRYWIAAYALDEAGARIESAPHVVFVAIPPDRPPRMVGAEASRVDPDPPLPAGTDEDFLRPQPFANRLASLRRAERSAEDTDILFRGPGFVPPTPEITGSASHMLASISRDEVQAGLGALRVADITINIDPSLVSGALDVLDQGFAQAGFPRTGLYIVECRVSIGRTSSGDNMVTSGPTCFPDFAGVAPLFGRGIASGVGYTNDLGDRNDAFFEAHHFRTRQSTAKYFIPRPDPGQRLVSARFESFLSVSGDLSNVQLFPGESAYERSVCALVLQRPVPPRSAPASEA